MSIRCIPLGAGQDVGRSCLILTIGGKNIMLDCGMHMGYQDNRRFPDFSYLSRSGNFNAVLDCVIISHFHLDHCGALPYFTEICGYDGPIYMTTPTRAIAPILLDDMRKVVAERKGDPNFFSAEEIRSCLEKVIPVTLHETVHVDADLKIKAYYAGHVLGAAMFHIQVGDLSVVYTGDYNMTPDRHLGAAWIDECRPDLLITETTYATTTRSSKRSRELDFLQQVHECVLKGGKVLIPVFALGRAQELCILIDAYWAQTGLKAPIYYSAGLTERANQYYRLFIGWTNEKIKSTFSGGDNTAPPTSTSAGNANENTNSHNMFDFKHIKPFDRTYADEPGPMVLFASPGMLHAGQSLDVFKKWCADPRNMVILPGYCVSGTVGAKVLAGEKVVEVDRVTKLQVNMQVKNLSFSAHADSKGILQLIGMCRAKNVMLVHGEAKKMAVLKKRIHEECKIPCYDPANGVAITIYGEEFAPVVVSDDALARVAAIATKQNPLKRKHEHPYAVSTVSGNANPPVAPFTGAVVAHVGEKVPRLLDAVELKEQFGLEAVEYRFCVRKAFDGAAVVTRHTQMLQTTQGQSPRPGSKNKAGKPASVADAVLAQMDFALRSWANSEGAENVSVVLDRGKGLIRVGEVLVRPDLSQGHLPSVLVEWSGASARHLATLVASVVGVILE
ncbi:beta-lactamase-like protein [Chytriomyces sp. MP71]|nr:beta-lactamase-like protein [Chytriomyces sp. MP71]